MIVMWDQVYFSSRWSTVGRYMAYLSYFMSVFVQENSSLGLRR